MNMLVDRRKDNYDELLLLARDARVSRTRANRWTTGIIASAIFGMGLYVASRNEQVDNLRGTAKQAERDRDEAQNQRNVLKANLDALKRYQDLYADIAPQLEMGDQIEEIGDIINNIDWPSTTVDRVNDTGKRPVTRFAVANLVWIVDGSRRFPLTFGDILWVPDGQFWIRMTDTDDPNDPNDKPSLVTIHRGARPNGSTAADETHDFGSGGDGPDYRVKVEDQPSRGVANCIKLTWHEKSNRAGFTDSRFVDMEVLFYNNPECPDAQTTPWPLEPASP